MKKIILIFLLIGTLCYGQSATYKIILDSVSVKDSIKTVYYKTVKIVRDTSAQSSMQITNLKAMLTEAQDRVDFTQQSIAAKKAIPIKNEFTKGQIQSEKNALTAYKIELDFYVELKKKFTELNIK